MDKGIKKDGNLLALGYRRKSNSNHFHAWERPEHDYQFPALNGDEILYNGYFIPVKKNSIY